MNERRRFGRRATSADSWRRPATSELRIYNTFAGRRCRCDYSRATVGHTHALYLSTARRRMFVAGQCASEQVLVTMRVGAL